MARYSDPVMHGFSIPDRLLNPILDCARGNAEPSVRAMRLLIGASREGEAEQALQQVLRKPQACALACP